jgi:hypothetical protein
MPLAPESFDFFVLTPSSTAIVMLTDIRSQWLFALPLHYSQTSIGVDF